MGASFEGKTGRCRHFPMAAWAYPPVASRAPAGQRQGKVEKFDPFGDR